MVSGSADAELTRSAQGGDVAALGMLLQRHEAGMRAVALSLLGFGPDVDDVVQDAALVALRRIGELRDPAAVGPWLRMIVRNACRTRLRSARVMVPIESLPLASTGPTPEQVLDQHASRDWIWQAIEELPAPIRMAVMLRHFSTGVTSYQQIAAACGVPVGTIRSRLSYGRAKLAEALRGTADAAHGDAGALTEASRQVGLETLAEAERGRFADVLAERWSPDVVLIAGGQPIGGREFLLRAMEGDLEAGVHQRLRHVVASQEIAIWETDLISPPDDPEHCPPAAVWLMSLSRGLVKELRLLHPERAVAVSVAVA
jgi:RNA polymerase sigma factor (sigma-70 family)